MRGKVALWGTVAAVLAKITNWAHGISHAEHQVLLAVWQWAHVIVVSSLAPIAAAILLWTRFCRVGPWLLVASMAGSFIFGLAYHYLVPSPDNVFTLHHAAWQLPFRVSAILVLLIEGVGSLVGVWVASRISRFSAGPAVAWSPGGFAGPRHGAGVRSR